MPSDHELIDRLLHEEEGTALDFKRDQYPFDGENDRTKSELLKDVLAFANSWRRSAAYILIGVEEVRGQRCRAVGVSVHLDDARLQQFVTSKTNRPVDFQYRQALFEGVEIGILEIPEQDRPTYLNRAYGKLDKDVVYLRRGSSTVKARPDEIARMGAVVAGKTQSESPELSIEWTDLESKTLLPSPSSVKSVILDPRLDYGTFSPGPRTTDRLFSVDVLDVHRNRDYSREVIDYTYDMSFLTPLGLRIRNKSGVAVRRVLFVGSVAKIPGTVIHEGLIEPSLYRFISTPVDAIDNREVNPRIDENSDRWDIEIDFGDIRPRDEIWITRPILFGSDKPGTIRLEGELRGDNIRDPITCELAIEVEVERREMLMSDVAPYLRVGWNE